MTELLRIGDFCEKYSISRTQLYRLAERGEIPMYKIGRATRVRVADAERWAKSLANKG